MMTNSWMSLNFYQLRKSYEEAMPHRATVPAKSNDILAAAQMSAQILESAPTPLVARSLAMATGA